MVLLAACSNGGNPSGNSSPPPPAAVNSLAISNTITPEKNPMNVADTSNSIMSAYKNTTENKTIIQICSVVIRIRTTTARNW